MQKNDNLFPQTNSIVQNKKTKKNFESNISKKLKGYAKIDTFYTFHETFLEIKYSTSSKQKTLKEEMKIQDHQNQKFNSRN